MTVVALTVVRQFLQHDYAVIFLHRESSLKPFHRLLSSMSLLDWVVTDTTNTGVRIGLELPEELQAKLQSSLEHYKRVGC